MFIMLCATFLSLEYEKEGTRDYKKIKQVFFEN